QQHQQLPPAKLHQSEHIKSEEMDQQNLESVSSDGTECTKINGKVHHKKEPTCSGDECHCAECRGEVVIKGERLPIDDQIVSDYDRARRDAEGQDRELVPEERGVQEVREVFSDAESEDDCNSVLSVHTPAHVPSFFSSE